MRKKSTEIVLVAALLIGSAVAAGAATTQCEISVLGGAFKGKTYELSMKDGKFVGDKDFKESSLKGCVGKKFIYGRWYHLCENSKIIVYRREGSGWKRLAAKNLKKYRHNCL